MFPNVPIHISVTGFGCGVGHLFFLCHSRGGPPQFCQISRRWATENQFLKTNFHSPPPYFMIGPQDKHIFGSWIYWSNYSCFCDYQLGLYCNAILYGLPKVLLNLLQLVQNRAAHIVTFTKKYEHITSSLIDLHWLPVEYRIVYEILLLVYKAINGLSPSYISNLLSVCSSSYSLRSCSNKLLQVPRSKLKSYGDRRFSIAGPKLCNGIPASLRNTDSLDSFKKHLKTYLFHQAFS